MIKILIALFAVLVHFEAAAAEPELFNPSHNACADVTANPQVEAHFKKSVSEYGAIGDGKSRTIGALKATGQITPAILKSISLVNSVLDPSFEVNDTDETDWVGIQAALVAAGRNHGGTVTIPSGEGAFMLNRSIWLYSNSTLQWIGSRYIVPTKKLGGSVISNVNIWDRPKAGAYNDHVCHVRIINPHVDGGAAATPPIYGQNGISFFNGAQDIHIIGGKLRNSRWCTKACSEAGGDIQGGRALQFESGVKDIYVDSTSISNTSIAFSSSGGLCSYKNGSSCNRSGGVFFPFRPAETAWTKPEEYVRNIAWNVNAKNLKIDNCELPFLFANQLFGFVDSAGTAHYDTELTQKASVTNFTVRNSGILLDQTLERNARPDDGAIISLVGATNINVSSGTIDNRGYSKIGSLIRGYGRNINISQIVMNGDTSTLIEFADRAAGLSNRAAHSSAINISSIKQFGGTTNVVRLKSVDKASISAVDYGKTALNQIFHRLPTIREGSQNIEIPAALP